MVLPRAGYMELEPAAIWGAVQSSCAALLEEIKSKCHINGISFSWFADDMLLLDGDNRPLTNILLYFDARAADTYRYFLKKGPEEICKKAVRGYSVNCEPMKALWFKQNEPALFQSARHMFDAQQFILSNLGLEAVNDDSLSYFKCVEDVGKRVWAKDILDLYELPHYLCAERIVSCCENLGSISKIGEVELPEPVPVFPGAHDELCAVLGLGVIPDNGPIISDMMGTSNTINFLVDYTGREDATGGCAMQIRTDFATYNSYGRGFPVLGGSLEWFARTFCANEPKSGLFDRLFAKSVFDASGNVLMVPWFGKHKVGLKGVTTATTPEQIFTALIEGLCYECSYSMAYNDELMMKQRGEHIRLVRAGGGGSQSDQWLQLRASLYNLPVQRTATSQAGAVGAGMIAATGLGIYKDFKEASAKMVTLGETFEPDAAQREKYMSREPEFKEFHDYILH